MTDFQTRATVTTPRPLTRLIGRERELESLQSLIRLGTRLITVTGIGGIGKTRLAHQVALELEPEFAAGALAVPLADIRDATRIPFAISQRLDNAQESIDLAALVQLLGPDARLLLLDNLEQIDGAGEFIGELLSKHLHLTVLVTSQLPLHVEGEHLFPLEPMPVADADEQPDQLRKSPAVALFQQRAGAAGTTTAFNDEEIRIVRDICAQLEGIPLAIELAAARSVILSPEELRVRLEAPLEVLSSSSTHRPSRQRTMRHAIAWTYDLLDRDEKRIFRFLSVYAGGLGLDAVEHTIKALESTQTPLDTLEFLISRNLIRRVPGTTEPRFHMLQTLRHFGQEQLDEEGDGFLARLTHAHYVTNLAAAAESHLQGSTQKAWYRKIGAELANIQAACTWSASERPELTLHVISDIWRAFQFYSVAHEFIALGKRALAHIQTPELLARGYSGVALLQSWLQVDLEEAQRYFELALQNAEASHSTEMIGRSLSGIGYVALVRGDLDTAHSAYTRAHEFNLNNHNQAGMSATLSNLAIIHTYRRDHAQAERLMLEALEIDTRLENTASMARTLLNLGSIANRSDRPEVGRDYATRALAHARQLGSDAEVFNALYILSSSERALGNLDAAEAAIREALPIGERAGRVADCSSLRTVMIDVHLDREMFAAANHVIKEILQVVEPERSPDAVLASAGSLLWYAWQHTDRMRLGLLRAGVAAWRGKTTMTRERPLPPKAKQFYDKLENSLSSDQRREIGLASEWSITKLRDAALAMALEIHSAIGKTGRSTPVAINPRPSYALTPRETEVLAMLAKGLTNAEIADEMYISLRTITTHVSNILAKLDVKNRAAAIHLALTEGLV